MIKHQPRVRVRFRRNVPGIIRAPEATADCDHRQFQILQGTDPLVVRRGIGHDAAVDRQPAQPGTHDPRWEQH
jgi:hypothetical protein